MFAWKRLKEVIVILTSKQVIALDLDVDLNSYGRPARNPIDIKKNSGYLIPRAYIVCLGDVNYKTIVHALVTHKNSIFFIVLKYGALNIISKSK